MGWVAVSRGVTQCLALSALNVLPLIVQSSRRAPFLVRRLPCVQAGSRSPLGLTRNPNPNGGRSKSARRCQGEHPRVLDIAKESTVAPSPPVDIARCLSGYTKIARWMRAV